MRDQGDFLRVRAADDPSSTLAVVIDLAPNSWLQAVEDPSSADAPDHAAQALSAVAEHLSVFLNSFLLLHQNNRALVFCALPGRADLVYPTLPPDARAAHEEFTLFASTAAPPPADAPPEDGDEPMETEPNGGANGASANGNGAPPEKPTLSHDLPTEGAAIRAALEAALHDAAREEAAAPAALSAALARALCMIGRMRRVRSDADAAARVLTITPCGTPPAQYVATMNVLFAAQGAGVPLDSLVVGGPEAPYLQQAAYLTGGAYVRAPAVNPPDVLQTLLTVFLVDGPNRDFIAMPLGDDVDFRAFCMLTGAVVDDGYACSVCLSTFDITAGKSAVMCPVCSARFAVQRRRPRSARPTT